MMDRALLTFSVVQTERSHEENQERAYIAASRRQDRSIEARMQSARMASEIHKRRTGKSFRITEDIVRKEEMYEEEEDDLPRSYRLLNQHMQTASPEFNARIEAWMTNRVAMSQVMQRANDEWQDNHINRLFAQSFPMANQQAQRVSRQMSLCGQECAPPSPQYSQQHVQQHPQQRPQQHSQQHPQRCSPPSPISPTFPADAHHDRSGSLPAMSPTHADSSSSNHSLNSLSPATVTNDGSFPNTPVATQPAPSVQGQPTFTSELPPEMGFMMNTDISNLDNQELYRLLGMESFGGLYPPATQGGSSKLGDLNKQGDPVMNESEMSVMGEEPHWDAFINENPWSSDQ